MHSIYEKELSLIFLFICTCWLRHSIVLRDHADGSRSVVYGGAHSFFSGSRCSCFFSTVLSETHAEALMPGACSYRLLHSSAHSETALHDTKAARKGTPSSCCFCAFAQQLGQLQQHPHKLLSIFRSVSPGELQKPHSFSNEQSHNAMTDCQHIMN